MNTNALYMKTYGKCYQALSCFVTNELTGHSHMSMNPNHLIGRGTVGLLAKKLVEDNKAA